MQADRHGAGTLAEDRHLARVAAEGSDVLRHPTQRQALVEDAVIAGEAQLGHGQKAQGAQAVVEGDHHHVARCGEVGAVIDRQGARAEQEGAAMDEDHDRQPLALVDRGARRPDVEEQAVLGIAAVGPVLRADGAERGGAAEMRSTAAAGAVRQSAGHPRAGGRRGCRDSCRGRGTCSAGPGAPARRRCRRVRPPCRRRPVLRLVVRSARRRSATPPGRARAGPAVRPGASRHQHPSSSALPPHAWLALGPATVAAVVGGRTLHDSRHRARAGGARAEVRRGTGGRAPSRATMTSP